MRNISTFREKGKYIWMLTAHKKFAFWYVLTFGNLVMFAQAAEQVLI